MVSPTETHDPCGGPSHDDDDLPLDEIFDTFANLYRDWARDDDGTVRHVDAASGEPDDAFAS